MNESPADSGRYFEPWEVRQSAIPPAPAIPEGTDPDRAAEQRAKYDRFVERADWLLWGSEMISHARPAVSLLTGEELSDDRRRIVATVRAPATDRPRPPSPGDLARRVAACVNYCRGLPDAALAGSAAEVLRELEDLRNASGRAAINAWWGSGDGPMRDSPPGDGATS